MCAASFSLHSPATIICRRLFLCLLPRDRLCRRQFGEHRLESVQFAVHFIDTALPPLLVLFRHINLAPDFLFVGSDFLFQPMQLLLVELVISVFIKSVDNVFRSAIIEVQCVGNLICIESSIAIRVGLVEHGESGFAVPSKWGGNRVLEVVDPAVYGGGESAQDGLTVVFVVGFFLLGIWALWWIVDLFLISGMIDAQKNEIRARLTQQALADENRS